MTQFWTVDIPPETFRILYKTIKAHWEKDNYLKFDYKKYDETREMGEWLKNNVKHKFSFCFTPSGHRDYDQVFFYNKEEAMNFKLVWG